MFRKQLSIFVALSLLITACSPPRNSDGPAPASDKEKGWRWLQSLVNAENSNVPLAEALSQLLREQSPEMLVAIKQQLEQESIVLIQQGNSFWTSLKQSSIVGEGSTAIADKSFLAGTLNLNPTELDNSNSFQNQLSLKVAGITQSIAMQNLMKAYDDQVRADSLEISRDLLSRMEQERPELRAKIESTKNQKDRSKQIDQIIVYLKQADFLLDKYKVSDADASRLVLYTAVASVLSAELSKNQSLKPLVQLGYEVKDLTEKVGRIQALTEAIRKHGEQLSKDASVMKNSVKGIFADVKDLVDDIEKGRLGLSEQGKKQANMFLDDLLNGRTILDPTDLSADQKEKMEKYKELAEKGFFQRKRELTKSTESFLESADSAAKSLGNILDVTKALATTLGVKLDPKVTQAMATAKKVTEVVQVVSAVRKAYQAGGVVNALAAFSAGGPATMALAAFGGGLGGNNGPDPAIMAELADIKESLQEIKKLQEEILENQKKTMTMIKDLALLIEENHRREMRAITDLSKSVLDVKDALAEIEMAPFASCEAMISYALNMSSSEIPMSLHSVNGSNADLVRKIIRNVTTTPQALRQFLNNSSPENFSTCQREMGVVFVSKKIRKFQRSIWAERGSNGRDGGEITRTFYDPAFAYLQKSVLGQEGRWQNLTLHLPVLSVDTLFTRKIAYLKQPGNLNNLYELRRLTETNKLEEFVSALLVLYPYLTIDLPTWDSSIEAVVVAGGTKEVKTRSQQMLANAFERVQIAVAQESILAGEPLLPNLAKDWSKIIQEDVQCDGLAEPEFCFVRLNAMMMQNLITYRLWEQFGPLKNDAEARKQQYLSLLSNPKDLARALFVPESRILQAEGRTYLKLSTDGATRVLMPEPEVVVSGRLQYTESMARMIRLQNMLADELIKQNSANWGYSKDILARSLFAQ